jgi:hypothetical protein
METARFILAILLLLATVYVVACNWGCVIVSSRNERRGIDRHHSTVPLLSVILTVAAWLISPWNGRHWLFAIPALDIANWMLLWLPVWLVLGGQQQTAAITSTDQNDEAITDYEDSKTVNDSES